MNKTLTNIREFFWPLLEKEDKSLKEINKETIYVMPNDKEDLHDLYNIVKHVDEQESERIKTIETKSMVLMGIVSLFIPIFVILTEKILVNITLESITKILLVLLYFFILLYTIRVEFYSIKALERKAYNRITPEEYLTKNVFKLKDVIIDMINNTKKNSSVINAKIDMMTMAQEYFKRSLITIFIFIVLLLIV